MNAYSVPPRFEPPRRPTGPVPRRYWQSGPLGADSLPVYGSLAGLLAVTAVLGTHGGGGVIRPLFILGCIGVAWRALKVGPAAHAEVITILFTVTPFLRRLVDLSAGFNPAGIMLVGPFLGLVLPLWDLKALLLQRPSSGRAAYTPYLVMTAALAYSWILSAFGGEMAGATVIAVKMFVPILYAMYLIHRQGACEEVLASVGRALMLTTPFVGLYGIYQYSIMPSWDRFWMLNSPSLMSIGLPEPMRVRVFSTMNSPGSLAMYLACGLLFYGFCRRGWLSLAMIFPISFGLLLSLYRTTWIAVVVGVGFCFMFRTTRQRAGMLTLGLIGAGLLAVFVTPFGAQIADRLTGMMSPSQDFSGHERLHEYIELYSDMDHFLFGNGMARGLTVNAQMLGVDGQFIASPVMMGIFVGNIHVLALIWACLQGVFSLRQDSSPAWLVAGAIVVGNVLILPLSIISYGEIGFPVWVFAALLTARQQQSQATGFAPTLQAADPGLPGWPHGA